MSEKIVRVRLEGDTSDIDKDLLRVKNEQKAVRQEQNKIYTEAIYTYTQVAQLGSMLLRNLDLGIGGLIAQQGLLAAQTALTGRRLAIESSAAFAKAAAAVDPYTKALNITAGVALAGLGVGAGYLYGEQLNQMVQAELEKERLERLATQIEQWS